MQHIIWPMMSCIANQEDGGSVWHDDHHHGGQRDDSCVTEEFRHN